MSRNQRLTFLGIAAVIAVVAIVILAGGSGDDGDSGENASATQTATPTATETQSGSEETATPTPTPTPKPEPPLLKAGSVKKLRYTEGETVRFRVDGGRGRGDPRPRLRHREGDPGRARPTTVSFKATITGIFEIEFHHSERADRRAARRPEVAARRP